MVAIPNGRKRLPAVRLKELNVSNYNLAFLALLLETPKELPRNGMNLLVAVPTACNISSSIDVNVKNRCSQSRNAKDFKDLLKLIIVKTLRLPRFLTLWCTKQKKTRLFKPCFRSGQRDSNPRHSAWEAKSFSRFHAEIQWFSKHVQQEGQ